MSKKITLILVSLWWGWTVLIDFAVVPTVFRVINDFFNAGELGIALFSKLNLLEVVIASLIIVMTLIQLKRNNAGKLQLALACAAWIIVMFYFSYLIERIEILTALWKKAEATNQLGLAGITDVQQEHQFYHRLYVGLDSLKLLLLSIMMGLELFQKEKGFAKT